MRRSAVFTAALIAVLALPMFEALAKDDDAPPKRSFLTLKGYIRLRGQWLKNFPMGVSPKTDDLVAAFKRPGSNDAQNRYGYFPFPYPISQYPENGSFNDDGSPSVASANMRLRLQPVITPAEGIEIHATIDMLDNLVLGSTPDGYVGINESPWAPIIAFSASQTPPQYSLNAFFNSIMVRHAWASIMTPVGVLRFGRMPSNWGLGILANSGKRIDSDYGDSVDRVMFITKLFNHLLIVGMDWVAEGPTSQSPVNYGFGQPYDLEQRDDVDQWVFAVARVDRGKKLKSMLEDDKIVFNYGAYFVYRTQELSQDGQLSDPSDRSNKSVRGLGWAPNDIPLVKRGVKAYIPDVWLRLHVGQTLRLEIEACAIIGTIENGPSGKLDVFQWAVAFESEYSLLEGSLKLGLWAGVASGDADFWSAWGMRSDSDNKVTNYKFDPNYNVDMILWRRMYGTITNAFYVRPSVSYAVMGDPWKEDGLGVRASAIYSQAMDLNATLGLAAPLGVELNLEAVYKADDGYSLWVAYGVLFPLDGLDHAKWADHKARTGRIVDAEASIAHTLQVRLAVQW